MYSKKIDVYVDPFAIAKHLKNERFPFFLDSGMDKENLGRYSILGIDPFIVIKSKNKYVTIDSRVLGVSSETKESSPFLELDKIMTKYAVKGKGDLPFYGGAVGYLSYDLKNHTEKLPDTAVDDADIPDMYMGIYDGAIIVDNLEKKIYITDSGVREGHDARMNNLIILVNESLNEKLEDAFNDTLPEVKWESNFNREDYIKAVARIKEYIRTGDVYQANMTQRFKAKLEMDPFKLYHRLRSINPAPFSAWLDYGDFQIASSSPERFLEIRDRRVETRPIKGTRPRGRNSDEDNFNRTELENSNKDKSELLMIVDLERNDLSKVAKDGTVKVPELFVIEEYPTVFHLVSTVTADIDDEFSTLDCIRNAFPGGSITGAPKIRAMEIIDELEPTTRNIYTGSIGYIDFNGNADLNIVIRTILIKDGEARFQTGGGIVWDSEEEKEYEETFHKARALMDALGINTDFISYRL